MVQLALKARGAVLRVAGGGYELGRGGRTERRVERMAGRRPELVPAERASPGRRGPQTRARLRGDLTCTVGRLGLRLGGTDLLGLYALIGCVPLSGCSSGEQLRGLLACFFF